jgi:hypothetical protein
VVTQDPGGLFVLENVFHPKGAAPQRVPHVWAHVGEGCSRTLIAFAPTGTMEAFRREVTKANVMPPQDPELWRTHGMELLGPH